MPNSSLFSYITDGIDVLLDPDKPHFNIWLWLRFGDWGSRFWHNSSWDSGTILPPPSSSTLPWVLKYPPPVVPLYYIAALGHLSLARRLVSERPQDLHARDDKGCTPLHIAVLAGNVEVSQFLIKHSVDLNIHDIEGRTVLHMAAYNGLLEVTRALDY